MLFGDRPVVHTSSGLSFKVRVESVEPAFNGLPVLGFTQRKPVDAPDLYPDVSHCLGASVLVGASGEAFMRQQRSHFKLGFKQPGMDEVMNWSLDPRPSHMRRPPAKLCPGDEIICHYSDEGQIQFVLNGLPIIDFSTGVPVDKTADYYAVIDVCFSATALTLMPISEGPVLGQEAPPLANVVEDSLREECRFRKDRRFKVQSDSDFSTMWPGSVGSVCSTSEVLEDPYETPVSRCQLSQDHVAMEATLPDSNPSRLPRLLWAAVALVILVSMSLRRPRSP